MKVLLAAILLASLLSACVEPRPRSEADRLAEAERLERMHEQRAHERAIERAIRRAQR